MSLKVQRGMVLGVYNTICAACRSKSTVNTTVLTFGPTVKQNGTVISVSYDRILSIENLSDVPNPWKGFTMNRCVVIALAIILVSSGVYELHDAVDTFVEETGIRSFFRSLQDGSITQIFVWDSFTWWWGSEEVGVIRRRKKPISSKTIMKPKTKE